MKIVDITPNKIRSISDDELTNMHSRIHSVYMSIKQRKSTLMEFGNILRDKHNIIVRQMRIRDIEHKTPIA